jgi:hypothetical protein
LFRKSIPIVSMPASALAMFGFAVSHAVRNGGNWRNLGIACQIKSNLCA